MYFVCHAFDEAPKEGCGTARAGERVGQVCQEHLKVFEI